MQVRRGHLYRILVEPEATALVLVISSNVHNSRHQEYIALPVSSRRSLGEPLPSWVPLRSGDPAYGHVICRYVDMVDRDELKEDLGELSQETMLRVGDVLKLTLGL